MKKFFAIFALMSMLMMVVGCGCRQTVEETVVDETVVEAVDTLAVPADSLALEAADSVVAE